MVLFLFRRATRGYFRQLNAATDKSWAVDVNLVRAMAAESADAVHANKKKRGASSRPHRSNASATFEIGGKTRKVGFVADAAAMGPSMGLADIKGGLPEIIARTAPKGVAFETALRRAVTESPRSASTLPGSVEGGMDERREGSDVELG